MQLLAYGDRRYERVTKRIFDSTATGGLLIASPPCQEPRVAPIWFMGHDAIYLDLHGAIEVDYLYGDKGTRALSLATVRKSWVDGAVVFLTSCWLPDTGFVDAFLDAGASAVIGGPGANWGGRYWPQGAQLLALYFLELYAKGDIPIEYALKVAKHRLRWDIWQRVRYPIATRDALKFRVWRRNGSI